LQSRSLKLVVDTKVEETVVKDKYFRDFFMKSPIRRLAVSVEPNKKYIYVEVNESAVEYFAMSKEEIIGKEPKDLFNYSISEQIVQSFETCVNTKKMVNVNSIPFTKGKLQIEAFVLNPIFDKKGNVKLIDIMARPEAINIDEIQRERDDALASMASFFDASGLGIVVTDHHGRIIRLNDTFLSEYGWNRDELLGAEFTILVPPEDKEFSKRLHDAFIYQGKQGKRELQFLKKDGSVAEIVLTMSLLELSQGRKFMVSTVRNVTERKNMVRRLERAKESADIANRAKSSFLANMSHELRTPLNAIIGFSELMKNEIFGSLNNPKYEEYMNDIHFSSRHLLDIINDVLDMSKIEAGKIELIESEIIISDLFESIRRIMGDRAEAKKVKLDFKCENNLPHVKADQRLLRQILINLVSNSIKFSLEGCIIHIKAYIYSKDCLRIAVEDEGCGIPYEKINTVQEPFGQVNDPRYYTGQGTGLGLPLAKAMIELHEGKLTIESEEDKGTNVFIDLPKIRVMEDKERKKT